MSNYIYVVPKKYANMLHEDGSPTAQSCTKIAATLHVAAIL